ncbi:MAG: WD40 repeat domain-containing protein [Bryobacteraceae bacterium]
MGVAAAARLGAAIIADVEFGSVSPDGSAALAVESSGDLRLYSGLRSGELTLLRIGNAGSPVDRAAWAPDGRSALVYATCGGYAQILSGLPAKPEVNGSIDLSTLSAPLEALIFDGRYVIAAPKTGGIYLAAQHGSIRQIAASDAPALVALTGSDLYFTNAKSQTIWRVSDYAGVASGQVFAEDHTMSLPTAIAASADGERLYVADAGNRSLVIYDAASHTVVERLGLDFTPSRLDRFGNANAFLMNTSGTGPLYVFSEIPSGKPGVYFVPPVDSRTHKLHLHPM